MTSSFDSPQARIASSRRALVLHMSGDDGHNGTTDPDLHQTGELPGRPERSSTWKVFTQALTAWWKHHPAHVAIDVGKPFLKNYAQDRPLQLLCIAAGVGAAAVLAKPWRLISITGMTVALLRSTTLSTTLLSMLPRPASKRHTSQTTQALKDSA